MPYRAFLKQFAYSNANRSADQFTIDFRFFNGSARTFLLAGFALNVIFSPVKGLMPSRALVAGRFTTFSLSRPGSVNRPLPRRLFLMMPLSDSNTSLTCLRESSESLEIWASISDLVGAPPFFAIGESPRVYAEVSLDRRERSKAV